MAQRTLVAAATNLLARGFLVVPTDRKGRDGRTVNALFAVARAMRRALAFKAPARAVAVIEARPPDPAWPPILAEQRPLLPDLFAALGIAVVTGEREADLVASYARAAIDAGDDVLIVGVDKRFAQLVGEGLWWYDANKDVRYTPEIVEKRFNVPPAAVAEWLAAVGDDSGNEVLPGVKGIGAKGATSLLHEHGSITAALEKLDTIEGRLGKVLRAAQDELARELPRGRLDRRRPLPVALEALVFAPPAASVRNTLYERLGFAELLSAESDEPSTVVTVCQEPGQLAGALAALGVASADDPIAVHALTEDAAPERSTIAGVALAHGRGAAVYVPFASGAWPELAAWLADPVPRKVGHDLGATLAPLRRAGLTLAGVVGDSACASHLCEPSNWAPHDLATVSKHALTRPLPDEEAVRGVGRQRKAWSELPLSRTAEHGGLLADTAAAVWQALAPRIEPRALLADYLELLTLCVQMELTGMAVDAAELDRAEAAFGEIERALEAEIEAHAGHPFNINSGKQLGQVLFEELKLPVAIHTKTGWSTSIEALERIEHAHPIVQPVLRWRALRRMRDSWILSLRRAIAADGRVHATFNPARSFAGQIVASNPDLSRVPGRTPEMARIRRAFVAGAGRLLMSVDFHQLGLYVLAHLTRDPALVEPLRQQSDMHRLTAAAVLDLPPEQVTFEQRQLGKVINFATFAGQGASALALQLGVSAAEAKAYLARFDAHYAQVRAFQDEQLRQAREQGYITTLAGRRWPIGGLESLDNELRSYAERLARRATHEASVQDVARRALLEADRAIRREGLAARPLLQILDEVLFDVPEGELPRAAEVCAAAMRNAYALEVPLVVGVEAGKTWADLEPVPLASSRAAEGRGHGPSDT